MNSLKPTDAQWSVLSEDKRKEYNKYRNAVFSLNDKLRTILNKYPVEKRFSGESFLDDNDKKLVKEYNRQITSLTRKANAIIIGTDPNKTEGSSALSDALDSMSYKWEKKTEEIKKENEHNDNVINSLDKEKEAKIEAAKEKTQESKDEVDVAIQVKNIAHNLIKKKLEQSLDEELDKLASSGNVSEETKNKMRLIIRNQKAVEAMHSTLITLAEAKTEASLNKYFKELERKTFGKTGAKIEKSAKKIDKKIDNVIGKIDRFDKKAQKLTDMTPKKFTKYLTGNLDQLLASNTSYGKICSKLDNAINNNKVSQFIGFGGFSTSQILAPVIHNIDHQIASKLTGKLQPVIQKYLGQVKGIVGTVLNFKNQVLASIQSFKSAIKNLKNLAVSYAKNFVSNLANKALSTIAGKLNIGGLGKGLGGSISANAAFSGRSDALGTA